MSVTTGARIGAYEVLAPIGRGGMGEVYRARDTRLKRDVALKVLPDSLASDPERLARFQREAEVLASLNHPNIAAIHGLEESNGIRALVMELVEGPTLADRIAQGPIPVDEALPIAKQIADALEAAHEQGIIHRDLKPANVKVRGDGTVKVLDFGLAKALEPASGRHIDATASPTITSPAMMTGVGVLLGTAAYMSPEQARGKVVDKRSDIWAFGCVLYEMLTGQRAFGGEDVTDTLAAVVRAEPAWDALPDGPSPSIGAFLRRCLQKNPRQRLQDIGDMRLALEGAFDTGGSQAARSAVVAGPRWRRALPLVAALVVGGMLVGIVAWSLWRIPSARPVMQFSFSLPEGQAFTTQTRQAVAISSEGTLIAYVANSRIYLRSIDDLEPREIPGTETGGSLLNPMFSPDGESIAYVESRGTVLKRIPISGGTASTMASMVGQPCGGTWSSDGVLIASDMPGQRGIWRVPAGGGMPQLIVPVGATERACGPQMLPGGDTVLFTLAKDTEDDRRWDEAQIVAQSLVDGSRRALIKGGSDARYVSTGHLLYAVAGTMYAVPFDGQRLAITGSAAPVVVGVRRSLPGQPTSATQLAVSDTGTLVYVPGPARTSAPMFDLAIGDGRGEPVPLKVVAAAYVHPRVSPDGRTLALGKSEGQATDIWTYDLAGRTELRRITFGGNNRFPVWSNDSRRITFQSGREGDQSIWWQPVDGGKAERLTKPADGEEHVPESWSRDGKYLLFSVAKGPTWPPRTGSYKLWVFSLEDRKAAPFGAESRELFSATFSPDGRWVAYAVSVGSADSPERGVFVEPFPATGEKHQAPRTEGRDHHPVWAPDGKSLFYVPDASESTVLVPIAAQPAFAFGRPVELTQMPRPGLQSWQPRGYDVLPDGGIVSVSNAGAPEVRVVINWTEELKRLVPTN